MSYAYEQAPARAGELGKGNIASAKTSAEMVSGGALKAGLFVALNAAGGGKAMGAKNQGVGRGGLGRPDAIWVVVADGETVARGDKVYAIAVANGNKKAGTIQGKVDATNAIATDYNVIDVKGQLALITKL